MFRTARIWSGWCSRLTSLKYRDPTRNKSPQTGADLADFRGLACSFLARKLFHFFYPYLRLGGGVKFSSFISYSDLVLIEG